MFKVNKKTAEQRHIREFDVLLIMLLITSVFIVDFEQLNIYWVRLSDISVVPLSLSLSLFAQI